jgi:hypothetical protein
MVMYLESNTTHALLEDEQIVAYFKSFTMKRGLKGSYAGSRKKSSRFNTKYFVDGLLKGSLSCGKSQNIPSFKLPKYRSVS